MPYYFGDSSAQALTRVNPKLVMLAADVLQQVDIAIISGHRGRTEQEALFQAFATKLHFPNSKHNDYPSNAIDFMPITPGRETLKRDYYFVAGIFLARAAHHGIAIRWGGDWARDALETVESFDDSGHIELIP